GAVTNRPRCGSHAACAQGESLPNGIDTRRARAIDRADVDPLTVEASDSAYFRLAQPDGALGDDVEHWLDVGRRARDDPEDLPGGRLLLEGLGHVGMGLREGTVLFLELREQPHVLDGDDRLVGEGLR